tara:strand:- start:768 stop:2684 length:1917 start_codon:yes stop_codon:yes gene_type:complete
MGKLIPFQPPPGVFKNGTPYQAKGRWSDCNLVRWKDGRLQPLGGWETVIGTTITGVGRAMITWRDFTGARWLAIGTNSNLYIFTSLSGTASDISPNTLVAGNVDGSIGLGFGIGDFGGTVTRATVTGTDISFTASGSVIASSSTVFTDATTTPVGPLPFAVGDEIEIAGSSESANNKTYPLSHRIVTVSANQMTVGPTNGSAVYGTNTLVDDAAGDSVTIKRTRRFGNENAASSSLVLEASSWIFDLWGENLIGMSTADGKIYEWDPTQSSATTTDAAVISNAPINNSAILVSKQRHLFAFGAGGNNKKIQWSHAETNTVWTATATNQAGAFEIDTSGKILAGKIVGDRILVWTSTDLHAVDWVGMPYVYGRKKVGDSCGAISNRAMIAVGDQAFWMSQGGFFQYQGTVQPLKCDVQDHIFKDINRVQDSKIYASINPEFFEVTWWYASSTSDEILKYVTYNYAEGWWSTGELCRTAFATGSPGVFDNPIGIADDGKIYEHEIEVSTDKRTTNQIAITNSDVSDFDRKLVTGTDATTDIGLCFAEAVMEIGDGENIANITQLVTDTVGVGDNGLRFKFKTSYTPNGTESTSSNYDLASDGYTDVREQGRQFTYRIESGFDQYWELGSIRAEVSAGGRR